MEYFPKNLTLQDDAQPSITLGTDVAYAHPVDGGRASEGHLRLFAFNFRAAAMSSIYPIERENTSSTRPRPLHLPSAERDRRQFLRMGKRDSDNLQGTSDETADSLLSFYKYEYDLGKKDALLMLFRSPSFHR